MGNAIYRNLTRVMDEYQYWDSFLPLSPLKTKNYPFQFIEIYSGDYLLYLSESVFEERFGTIRTKTLGKKYKFTYAGWDYLEDLNQDEYFNVEGDIVYANANIEVEQL